MLASVCGVVVVPNFTLRFAMSFAGQDERLRGVEGLLNIYY